MEPRPKRRVEKNVLISSIRQILFHEMAICVAFIYQEWEKQYKKWLLCLKAVFQEIHAQTLPR